MKIVQLSEKLFIYMHGYRGIFWWKKVQVATIRADLEKFSVEHGKIDPNFMQDATMQFWKFQYRALISAKICLVFCQTLQICVNIRT